jgi:transposase
MRKQSIKLPAAETVYVGIDVHNRAWHITIRTADVELFSGSIPGSWEALRALLERYKGHTLEVVYEAGYSGFWLHDRLLAYGAGCVVTPPSLVPRESGNRVKTDKRDSRKLALLLAKGMLKRVVVPTEQELQHRQVVRRRRQLIRDRVRTQNRIKAELRFYGVPLPAAKTAWSRQYVENLKRLKFASRWMTESFKCLLEQYDFLTEQVNRQTRLLKRPADTEEYRERVQLLTSIPGVGLVASMELLLELQDVARFRRAEQLAAYVGLTPSQYSSGEQVRMGRITRAGKGSLRSTLVESAWHLIGQDGVTRSKYERIKARAGAKRAIVAVARHVLLVARRLLLDKHRFVTQPLA